MIDAGCQVYSVPYTILYCCMCFTVSVIIIKFYYKYHAIKFEILGEMDNFFKRPNQSMKKQGTLNNTNFNCSQHPSYLQMFQDRQFGWAVLPMVRVN